MGDDGVDEIGVVGFDDVYIAQMVTPELTTIRQPKYDIGYKAADMLIDMINSDHGSPREYVLNTELIIRNSTV